MPDYKELFSQAKRVDGVYAIPKFTNGSRKIAVFSVPEEDFQQQKVEGFSADDLQPIGPGMFGLISGKVEESDHNNSVSDPYTVAVAREATEEYGSIGLQVSHEVISNGLPRLEVLQLRGEIPYRFIVTGHTIELLESQIANLQERIAVETIEETQLAAFLATKGHILRPSVHGILLRFQQYLENGK